jgi:hypothetical protein
MYETCSYNCSVEASLIDTERADAFAAGAPGMCGMLGLYSSRSKTPRPICSILTTNWGLSLGLRVQRDKLPTNF